MERKESSVLEKITAFAPQAEVMPAVVIVQQLEPFKSLYMNSRGLRELGITHEELVEMGTDYLHRFFNLEDSEGYRQKLMLLLKQNDADETFTFFQQVRFIDSDKWIWHIGSTRIFFWDELGNPTHMVTIAVPVNQMKHIPNKAERILAERDFYHRNLKKFLTLGNREREVLRLVALGKSSSDIAGELFISIETVNTHRKVIKRKLDISSGYDFTFFAHAFDLI